MAWIRRDDALKLVQVRLPDFGVTEKVLENWTRSGRECPAVKQGARLGYDGDQFEQWLKRITPCLVQLSQADYLKCLNFAIEAYYGQMTRADFNRVKQRDVGEFLTNQVEGKLGEIAVQKLLERAGAAIDLDFRATGQIPSQDITQVQVRGRVWNVPAVKVSIKSTKFKNFLLAVGKNEVTLADRISDIYVLSNVGMPADHLLRIFKSGLQGVSETVRALIPDFGGMPARVSGWIRREAVTARPMLKGEQIEAEYGVRMSSENHIVTTGELDTDWPSFVRVLTGT